MRYRVLSNSRPHTPGPCRSPSSAGPWPVAADQVFIVILFEARGAPFWLVKGKALRPIFGGLLKQHTHTHTPKQKKENACHPGEVAICISDMGHGIRNGSQTSATFYKRIRSNYVWKINGCGTGKACSGLSPHLIVLYLDLAQELCGVIAFCLLQKTK